jgi:hypothetical protein
MPRKDLYSYQKALDKHRKEVLQRIYNNKDLIAQIESSLERIERGEPSIPLSEIKRQLQEEARARDDLRSGGAPELHGAPGC